MKKQAIEGILLLLVSLVAGACSHHASEQPQPEYMGAIQQQLAGIDERLDTIEDSLDKDKQQPRDMKAMEEHTSGISERLDTTEHSVGKDEQPKPKQQEMPELQQAKQEDFVLEVELDLPHKIPSDRTDGLWVSSVPPRLDVLIFPKGSDAAVGYIARVDAGQDAAPFYLGKTPLYAELKPGEYELVIFHPPLEEVDETYEIEMVEQGEINGPFGKKMKITGPKCPFIGPSGMVAVMGRYFWVLRRDVEIDQTLKTVIGLFQRRDKHFSYLLPSLPEEESFEFTMADYLRDFRFPGSRVRSGIPEEDIEKALELIHRGGVLGWESDTGEAVIEITGKNDTWEIHVEGKLPD